MYLFDISILSSPQDHSSTPMHDRYEKLGFNNNNSMISTRPCIGNASILVFKGINNEIKKQILIYKKENCYYVPIFYPSFAIGFFNFDYDNNNDVKRRLQLLFKGATTVDNEIKAFPYFQESDTFSTEFLASVFLEDNISTDYSPTEKQSLKDFAVTLK